MQYAARVSTGSRKPALSICLFSSHGLFLTQFSTLIGAAGFQPQTVRLEPGVLRDPNSLSLAHASVYVLDLESNVHVGGVVVPRILENQFKAPLVVLREKFEESSAFPMLRMGVKGLLNYGEATAQLPRALEAVAGGGYWVPRTLLARFVESILVEERTTGPALPSLGARLSPREIQILDALLENRSNKEIANQFNISERTVKFHVSNLLSKYGVQRRADLILLGFQHRSVGAAGVSSQTV